MYCEDADLCYKIQKAGYKNFYIPSAVIVHYGGTSSGRSRSQFSNVMMRESVWRFFLKTRGCCYGIGYRAAMMVSALCRLVAAAAASPFRLLRGEGARTGNSARKWMAILGWSLGAQSWVKKYD
jgi:GT2 family glycosyltransferase